MVNTRKARTSKSFGTVCKGKGVLSMDEYSMSVALCKAIKFAQRVAANIVHFV